MTPRAAPPDAAGRETCHATCVAISGRGVLLRGPPGAGKSDLALRLIDGGARLIADDRVELRRVGARVFASAPAALAGLLEVRGLGIVRLPAGEPAPLALVADLDPAREIERLPEAERCTLCGIALPLLAAAARRASAAALIRVALRAPVACPASASARESAPGTASGSAPALAETAPW